MPLLETFANASVRGFRSGINVEPQAYELISTVMGDGSSSTITFSSIPATYKHLQIRGIMKQASSNRSDATTMWIRINGDTSNAYAWHFMRANGTGIFVGSSASTSQIINGYTSGAAQPGFGPIIVDILDYANTNKTKTLRTISGSETANTTYNRVAIESGLWNSTSALTSISFIESLSLGFSSGTRFSLYGIRG